MNFQMNGGAANPNRNYILLGSITGTTPGTPLPGGLVVLPLRWDLFTGMVISLLNTTLFEDFLGTLDATGKGSAKMSLPPLPPGSAGLKMSFAFACNAPWDYVSNSIPVHIVP